MSCNARTLEEISISCESYPGVINRPWCSTRGSRDQKQKGKKRQKDSTWKQCFKSRIAMHSDRPKNCHSGIAHGEIATSKLH